MTLAMADGRPSSSQTAPWRARLFGGFDLAGPDGAVMTPVGRKPRALLAYLILTGERTSRERIAGLFWGDRGSDQARASVRQALYELRAMSEGQTALLQVDRAGVQVRCERVSTDLDAMRDPGLDATGFAELLGEHPRELLADLNDVDPGFAEWLAAQRARRSEERQALGLAVAEQALEAGDAAGALRLASALMAAEPFDEAAVRLSLMGRAALGDRAGVRQTFRQYERAVREELGLEPSPELVALESRLSADPPPRQGLAPKATAPKAHATTRRRGALLLGLAALALVAAISILGWVLWQGRDRPRILRVDALAAPAADAPAQALRVGFSADLAQMVLGNDARLAVEDPRDQAPAAARRADYVINGEARSGDGVLHANLRLLDGRSGAILWSQSFARKATEADALRAQIAGAAADVGVCVEGGHRPPPDMDAETLRLYLEGCQQKHGDWARSARLLAETVRRRPDFAHGWAMFAAATGAIAPDGEAGASTRAQADAYARRALALDPDEGEAWDARSEAAPGPRRWKERMALLAEGHRRDPDNAIVNVDLAYELADVGRRDEALSYAQLAVQHDPFSQVMAGQLIRLLGLYGQRDDAASMIVETLRRWPGDPFVSEARFRIEALSGDPEAALRLLATAGADFGMRGAEANAWKAVLAFRRTPSPQARAAAETAIWAMLPGPDPSYRVGAMTQFSLVGDLDAAYAVAAGFPDWEFPARWVLFYDAMAPFRADRRFMAFAARQGLVEAWRSTGRWPDFCRRPSRPYDCPKAAEAAGF
ncbi:MAG: hypothetical protein JSR98_09505 [Proteobacteria bacterium]|nr:hypothetical protein [Pseudomonadota bacterium]